MLTRLRRENHEGDDPLAGRHDRSGATGRVHGGAPPAERQLGDCLSGLRPASA